MSLFEAARWAPSSYNNQPWRIMYARRGTPHWQAFFDLMVPQNQEWTKNAAALLVFVSKSTFDFNGKPYPTHSFDTGAAWGNLGAARLAQRLRRPRHARLRLRSRENSTENTGRIPRGSDDRGRQAGKKRRFTGANSKTRSPQRTQETIRNRLRRLLSLVAAPLPWNDSTTAPRASKPACNRW